MHQEGRGGRGEDESPGPAPGAITVCFDEPHRDCVPSQYSAVVSVQTDSVQRGFNIGLTSSRDECKEPPFKIPYFYTVMCRGERGSNSRQPGLLGELY